jgi:hypothetical protein
VKTRHRAIFEYINKTIHWKCKIKSLCAWLKAMKLEINKRKSLYVIETLHAIIGDNNSNNNNNVEINEPSDLTNASGYESLTQEARKEGMRYIISQFV